MQKESTEQKKLDDIPSLKFSNFLEHCPPNRPTIISDLRRENTIAGKEIHTPEITLQCTQEPCQGQMIFKCAGTNHWNHYYLKHWKGLFLAYQCKNCESSQKLFSLIISEHPDKNENSGLVVKLGEWPPFGPRTSNRLLRMLGDDKDLFLLGRRAENQGLGIGAFTYYRRVVENQRGRLIDEIIKVVKKVETSPDEIVENLIKAKETFQFSQSIKDIKILIPKAIEIDGHNPLLLLHSALSAGIHDQSDSECLELAKSIRLVLVELVERLVHALAQKTELNNAVSKLLQTSSKKDDKKT